MKRRTFAALALAAGLATQAQGQGFPSKPVRFIVPYAAGGLPDSVARIVAQKLTERMGQSVVVDNKPGGNGVVAYQNLMQGSNDNHSFIVSDGSMLSITPLINKAANYAVGKELSAVSLIARSPLFLVAHPKTGVKTLKDFVDKVRASPGTYTYGSSGIGSTHHLSMEALKAELKLDLRHVPFRGSGQSVPALLGGQVDFLFSALPSMIGFVKNNQVTLIGSNDSKRSPQVPEVPAIAELLPGYESSAWFGLFGPGRMAPELSRRLSDAARSAIASPEVKRRIESEGATPVGNAPQEFAAFVQAEIGRWAQVVKHSGARPE